MDYVTEGPLFYVTHCGLFINERLGTFYVCFLWQPRSLFSLPNRRAFGQRHRSIPGGRINTGAAPHCVTVSRTTRAEQHGQRAGECPRDARVPPGRGIHGGGKRLSTDTGHGKGRAHPGNGNVVGNWELRAGMRRRRGREGAG